MNENITSISRDCPECGKKIRSNATACSCGWGAKTAIAAYDPRRFDCAYQQGSTRCKYPGSTSFGTRGDGPWYCRVHARAQGDREAAQVLSDSQSYKLEQPKYDRSWLDVNFAKEEFETEHEYQMRCKDFALSKLQNFGLKNAMVEL